MLHKLYGGAITTEILESDEYNVVDVSTIRDIPDTQEVFILEKNNGEDVGIIFDILELVEGDYNDAIKVHISDLIEQEVENTVVETINNMTLSYVIHDNKRRDGNSSSIVTLVNLVRLQNVDTDILISMNIPWKLGVRLDVETHLADEKHDLGKAYLVFKVIAEKFVVKDWSLFG